MKKSLFASFFIAMLLTLAVQRTAFGQSELPRVEVGAHYTLLRFEDFDTNDSGVGLRGTINLTKYLAVEGEFNFLPERQINFADPNYLNGRRYQGLFGVKSGVRSEKFGVFGKVRPGFIHFGESTFNPLILPIVPVPPTAESTEFALDIGGVFEFYPSKKTLFRFDLGDTIIRFDRSSTSGRPSYTSHNLQLSTGFGLRF